MRHLGELIDSFESRGVGLRILSLGLDTTNATGKLMLNVLGSVAQFEREMMLERQREGIAKAKAEGKYKGRKPTAKAKTCEVLRLIDRGCTVKAVARELQISDRSIYRILARENAGKKQASSSGWVAD